MMIRKLFTVIIYCGFSIISVRAAPVKTIINCTVHGPKESGINLYELKDGYPVNLGFQRPDVKGNCSFNVNQQKEGVYFFAKAGGKGSDYKYVIYLKKGDQKRVDFFLDRYSIDYDSCLVTNPNAETKVLQTWVNELNKCVKSLTFKTEGSYVEHGEFKKSSTLFLKSNKTGNVYFDKWIIDKVNTDVTYLKAAMFFGFNKRLNSTYDSSESAQGFYKSLLNKAIVSDPALLRSEHGLDLLNYIFAYWKFNEDKSGKNLTTVPFSENLAFISNNEVKVAYIANKMQHITKYEDFVKQVQPSKALFVNEEHKLAYQKKYQDLYLFAKGTPGYNFELKDVNEKTYTLAGFKGKVVVIDMWAMWCAPCLAEKPVMEKIAEEFKDRNDIVFVGVSVDGLNRRPVWKDFVKKNGFTSIELLSNSTESIQEYYKILGIPRFLIFDREGKIVTVDAPRPSNPGFKKMLDTVLGIN